MLIAVFLLCLILIFISYGWFLSRQEQVRKGLAKPKFPYRDYTVSEMKKMFPQFLNEGVKTTQTPEQTHKKFMTALKKSDFSEAVKCCVLPSKQTKIKKIMEGAKKKGMLNLMISDLSEIKKEMNLDTTITYTYSSKKNNKNYTNTIIFKKDQKGIFLIEKL